MLKMILRLVRIDNGQLQWKPDSQIGSKLCLITVTVEFHYDANEIWKCISQQN